MYIARYSYKSDCCDRSERSATSNSSSPRSSTHRADKANDRQLVSGWPTCTITTVLYTVVSPLQCLTRPGSSQDPER